jgi:hypothetical protein
MSTKIFAIACACLVLAAPRAVAKPALLAELIAATPTEEGLSITVPTGGCTTKADFEVSTQPAAEGAAQVAIRRLKQDYCKGNFPEGLTLLLSWSDLKLPTGTKLIVKNLLPTKAEVQKGPRKAKATTHGPGKRCKQARRRHSHCKPRHARRAARAGAAKRAVIYHDRHRQRAGCHWLF